MDLYTLRKITDTTKNKRMMENEWYKWK